MSTEKLFLEYSTRKLSQLANRIQECLRRLSEEQIWARGSEGENAVGNLVLHLAGNVRQWIGSGVGRLPDVRDRDAEFAARGLISREELWNRLDETVKEANRIIEGLTASRLQERVTIQNYEVSVLEAVYHVVEHFSQHTGQIIFATKLMTRQDLGFYGHLSAKAGHQETVP
ncbi:MAG: DUF1572 family protein [Bryobacteraceae bacterium]|nr:DUF1572 family protein [Bryobacteraceae bacterium]